MSLPSPNNDYAAPANMTLNKASWDAAMTSIGERLRAREELEASFQNLISLGVGQAIAAVQNEIAPTAAQAQAHAQQIETLLDILLATSIPATLISVTPSMRFTSDAEMASKASASGLTDLIAAVALKAPLDSPEFSGVATAPTAAPGANTQQVANTAFVHGEIADLLGGAPGALNTLNELAAALGDDANFAATMTMALAARLRFDAAQSLSAGEKTQGRANLGLGSLATQSAVNAADLPAGARILLATLTASNSAALSDSSHFTSDYDDYEIIIDDILPATNAVSLELQVHSGGTYKGSAYYAGGTVSYSNASGSAVATNNGTSAGLTIANIANTRGGVSGLIRLHKINQTANPKKIESMLSFAAGSTVGSGVCQVGSFWDGNGAVDGIQLFMNSGNITSGSALIYGIKK
ncbi:hypothetical protein IYW40_15295 [Methylocystis sp. H4A]|uniref:hypothetical protein n=1 Tax=Methylocystis sp. H4A TaxID=2785788 RepID=UPI0018C286B9|nr:hypothetical protein [Methylocystis sp. H4A]MBG0802831.1 hypothetical protein [Methylocystis sp. H4A]